ncbi:MAG: hypothetical protein HON90_03295, partial [Halobacteriovoraceae bacterium]|nr:hypothetical protein [Halobacteriovoraceae bacterium]
MDIKKIFNIILLALSLSTIFITLISYIIFKLRQAVSANIDHDEDQLDGTYFRKYNPELEKINEEKKQESDALAKNPKKAIFKFVGMAVFVFLCIFTVFMLEDYFKYREQVKNKMMSAHDFKQLIAEGLLAKHDYNPYHGPVKISEKLSNNAKAQMKQFVTSFKNQNFCVASNTRTQQLNFNDHNKAKKAWLEFFARHSLKATVHENIKNIPDCFWIFPHIKSLSRKEWAIVSPILKQKRSIITGSFYALNGIGKKNKNNPFYEIFPSRPQAEKKISATLVHAESDSFWDIPAGRLLNWHPINKNWSFIESKKITSLVAGKFEGRIFKNKNNDYAAYKSRFQKAK